MVIDKFVNFMIEAALREEKSRNKSNYLREFTVERSAKSLVTPASKLEKHHRGREKHYTKILQDAEKELREKGISVELYDPLIGAVQTVPFNLASGSISNSASSFQPKIDSKLLDAVKNAKAKMFEHRNKAETYEKFARAFKCANPQFKIKLSVEDVHFFQL